MTSLLIAWAALVIGFLMGLEWAVWCEAQRRRERLVRNVMSMIWVCSKIERVQPRPVSEWLREAELEGIFSN